MRKSKCARGTILAAALALAIPPAARAQDQPPADLSRSPVRLSQLIEEVRRANPETRAAGRRSDAALEMESQEGAFEDPMVRLSYSPRPAGMRGTGFLVEQAIPFWGVRGLKGEAARERARGMEGESRAQALDAVAQAQRVFHEWLLARRGRELNQNVRSILEQFKSIAEQRYRAGLVPQSDPLRAAAELSRLAVLDEEFLRAEGSARAQVNLLLGREPLSALGDPEDLSYVLAELPEEGLLEQALEHRPEVGAARARLREWEARETLSRRAYWPDFTVGAEYKPKALAGSQAQMGGDYDDMVSVMLGFNLPLQVGAKNAAAREASFEREAAEFELEASKQRALFEVRAQYLALRQARKTFELYRNEIVPATKLALDATRRSYENDRAAFVELLDAERTYQDVLFEESRALHGYHAGLVDIERATGAPPGHHHGNPSEKGEVP